MRWRTFILCVLLVLFCLTLVSGVFAIMIYFVLKPLQVMLAVLALATQAG